MASDTSWMMYYEGKPFGGNIYSLKPEDFSNEGAFHYCVSAFSKSGKAVEIDSASREEYRMILNQTLMECYENYGYVLTLPTKEQIVSHGYKWENSPIYVLFQYDKENGLQVHHICESIYVLEQNQYISLIERFSDLLCTKWNVNKIIFTAPLMSKID